MDRMDNRIDGRPTKEMCDWHAQVNDFGRLLFKWKYLRPTWRQATFRAISSARLWRHRLYTCALSTSWSATTLKEIKSCGGLRA